jgi:hypothetical protein
VAGLQEHATLQVLKGYADAAARMWTAAMTVVLFPAVLHSVCVPAELAGKRPLFPPGIDLSPDEAEVIHTFRWVGCDGGGVWAHTDCACVFV